MRNVDLSFIFSGFTTARHLANYNFLSPETPESLIIFHTFCGPKHWLFSRTQERLYTWDTWWHLFVKNGPNLFTYPKQMVWWNVSVGCDLSGMKAKLIVLQHLAEWTKVLMPPTQFKLKTFELLGAKQRTSLWHSDWVVRTQLKI